MVARINGTAQSTSTIVTVADETRAVSMECTSLGGNRLRDPGENSLVVVNSFLDADWGLGERETVSNSLRRFSNMTDRLAEHPGTVDAETVRHLMDLTLFDKDVLLRDADFIEGGGCTKPTKQDADATNYQTVVDTRRQQSWIKIPSPDHFANWTHFDVPELWS